MALNKKERLRAWGVTLLAAALIVFNLPGFFRFIGERPGIIPVDAVLALFRPVDLSLPLFAVLYSAIILAVQQLFKDPDRLLRGAQAYVIMLGLRMVSMTLLTLEPPPELLPLMDPVTQVFYPAKVPFTKDLFFSGHTATMFLLFLALPKGLWKSLLLLVTLFVGAAVLLQHVHWTIDVVAAPFAAWLAWLLSRWTFAWSRTVPLNGAEAA